MNKAEIVAVIRAHAQELQDAGVAHVALFGSAARNEVGPDSDVDLVLEGPPGRPVTLFSMARAERVLLRILNRPVDLTAKQGLEAAPNLKARIAPDLTPIF